MRLRACFVFVIGLGLFCLSVSAQVTTKPESLSIPGLQKRIKSIQDSADLAAGLKEDCLYYLQKAVERIEISEEQIEIALSFERRLSQVADAIPPLEQKLAALPQSADPAIANIQDNDELDKLIEAREKLIDDPQTGLRKQVADLDHESEVRRIRPEEILNEVTEVENRLREIEDENDGLATAGESKDVMQAHQLFLQARRQRAECELRALRAESEWFQSSNASDYLQLEQELAAKTLALKIAELEILHQEFSKRRGDEADQRVHQAELVLAKASDDLKPLAEKNLELAKELREIAKKLRDVEHRHESTSTTIVDLDREFDRTRRMVEEVGLTDSIGLLLRQQRAKLLDSRTMRSNLAHRSEVVRETRMKLFQLDLERSALIDLDAAAAKRSEEMESAKGSKSVAAGLRSLLAEQKQLLNSLESDYTKYFKQLIQMDQVERRMLELTTKYSDYVDELVLWIRTGQMFGRDHLSKSVNSLGWLIDKKSWPSVVDAGWLDFSRRPLGWTIASLALLVWIGARPFMKRRIRQQGEIAARSDCRHLWPTLQSLALTLLVASGWPFAFWFVGWRLDHSMNSSSFAQAVADGLMRAAIFAWPLEILRVTCLRGGLAERHFGWPQSLVDGWRRNVTWFLPIGVILVTAIGLIEGTGDEHRLDASGRLVFLAFTAISALFSHLTIRRAKTATPAGVDLSTNEIDAWSNRCWRFAPPLAVVACLGLFTLCWSGYFYTALQLTWRFQRTAWLVVGLVMLRATIRRWIALERRRMAILQDAELLSIAEAGREPSTIGQSTFLFPRWHWPDFRLNLTQIVGQMRSLFDIGLITTAVIGLWVVWADVTPALNILDGFTLWETTVERTVTRTDKERGDVSELIKKPQPVTAADLGLAFMIVGISVVAGRNIPGLIEVILLEHLSVDAGVRFAATCLVRYAIFIAGVILAFAQISIGWSNVQWLVAAASVGLGFGLQEIFCNFVSGIILLFERPMRVGDVITIGDTTGTISRIRFRATTIVDGDRKELIVPNKEFITGKLLNWTLSDRVNRVGVKVVVGSDNDPQRVRAVLLDIAAQHPKLLKDPAPSATLEELNGGLTFMLRAFLPTLDGRSTAINDLYSIIHDRFQKEGIEMPCPRQEVVVRMDSPSAVTAPPPHQSPANVPVKPLQTDFGSSFRRA